MSDHRRRGPLPTIGTVEWFRAGEHERVERVVSDMSRLNVVHLRTGLSWSDYCTPEGPEWYDWLMAYLAGHVEVLPFFTYTPPSPGIEPKTCSPPPNPKEYADFLDSIITRHGEHFEWVELSNEPNTLSDWDWKVDASRSTFREMITAAALTCRRRGKKTVLGGMGPTDPVWLDLFARDDVLGLFDAVGIHGFPGSRASDWPGWETPVLAVQGILNRHEIEAQVWITEAGYSTRNEGEFTQMEVFADLLHAPAERVYWYSVHDLHPEKLAYQNSFQPDERHFHFGLFRADGRPKLLSRVWSTEGIPAVGDLVDLGRRHAPKKTREANGQAGRNDDGHSSNGRTTVTLSARDSPAILTNGSAKQGYTLITGGAGFIGTNLAVRLLEGGRRLRVLDNLARPGVEKNLQWLCERYDDQIEVQIDDVRNFRAVSDAVAGADQVFHFAAQVAVTSSVSYPEEDFEINARGTLNVLEALRTLASPPPLLFTSTNKVYGALDDVRLDLNGTTYTPLDERFVSGVGPDRALDFESPYGCSKGAADAYVLDYSRMFGLPTVVFRMSCIYGPHQFGTEDQGWIAHFLLCALRGEPITIYGDGRQVRDILFVDDLIRGMVMTMNKIEQVRGRAYNVGGGPARSVSLLQVLDLIKELHGDLPDVSFSDWRPSDQKFYVSDTRELERTTGWRPEVGVEDGLRRLYEWILEESPVHALQSTY